MAIIKLDQANKAVNIVSCSLEHPLIFKYFDDLPVLAAIYCQRIADQLGITFPAFLRIGNLPHWGKPSESLEIARGFLGNSEV